MYLGEKYELCKYLITISMGIYCFAFLYKCIFVLLISNIKVPKTIMCIKTAVNTYQLFTVYDYMHYPYY